jgi:SOS-response transcriptional repressor LexA
MKLWILRLGGNLTPKQKTIFLIIDEFWRRNGFGPSIDDIMSMTGDKGRGNVARQMWKLVEMGYCKGVKNRARSVRPSNLRIRDIE